MAELAFSEACERNKGPLLDVLEACLPVRGTVLEVGSGTGQHAVHFATHFPGLTWQPTEMASMLPSLQARLQREAPVNVAPAVELDVRQADWPVEACDAIFSANTLHYMAPDSVERFFEGVGRTLAAGGKLIVYGPFRYNGQYTSPSNARFDSWLRASDPVRAIRDFEWVCELAGLQGLRLSADHAMPAHNQTLIWERPATTQDQFVSRRR